MLTPEQIGRLAAFLDGRINQAWGLSIENLVRIHGGASRETYSFDIVYENNAGPQRRGLVLRRDPAASLIETDRAVEFAAYRSFHGSPTPVPEAIALVTDTDLLGAPFFVMSRIEDGRAASPFQKDPYGPHAYEIGRQFFSILGAIAARDPYDTQLPGVVETPEPETCWRRELDHWEAILRTDALEPQPIALGAIRRLRANPPPPPQRLAVVHGDYRNGNFLHDGRGRILAVLDWEMAHIGDPLEDLAWALDPLWSLGRPERAAGLMDPQEAIGLWEEASGVRFDPCAFAWWRLFASVKGAAIWVSSARAFQDSAAMDPVLAFSGWYCGVRHNAVIAERLEAAAPGAIP